jgi:hypothetical protein
MPLPTADIQRFVSSVLVGCPEISSVWSMEHAADAPSPAAAAHELLAFADKATLQRLRRSENLQRADVEFLVVIDGDVFESAWGPRKLSGSLARWAWRQISAHEAYYDESRWQLGEAGSVVRVRRKALLLWQAELAAVH